MADWKYVMFEDPETGQQVPILFPNQIVHADIAKFVPAMLRRADKRIVVHPVAAGFVSLAVSGVSGESESMGGVKSRPEDAQTINVYPYSHGMTTGMEPRIEAMLLIRHVEHLMERVTGKKKRNPADDLPFTPKTER